MVLPEEDVGEMSRMTVRDVWLVTAGGESVQIATADDDYRLRPYYVESTGSRPITEVKQRRARLVLGWVTAWEYRVP